MNNFALKKYPTLGCCGLDCGLCPRFYIEGSSKCPGCCGPNFFEKHPGCGHITCCFKKNDLEVCALCTNYPCIKFDNWFGDKVYDSFLTHKKVESNHNFIKKFGLNRFIENQNIKMQYLNEMLNDFNDNRSKNLYCIAVTLLLIDDIKKALQLAKKEIKKLEIKTDDYKSKAKILRGIISEIADKKGIDLKLRRPKK